MGLRLQRKVLRSALPADVRFAALVMALYADEDGGSIFPTIDTLAADMGVSRATVKRQRKKLCDLGVLVKARPGGGRHRSAHYKFLVDRLEGNRLTSAPVMDAARGLTSAPVRLETGLPVSPVAVETGLPAHRNRLAGKPIQPSTTNGSTKTTEETKPSVAARPLLPSPSRLGQTSPLEGVVVDDREQSISEDALSAFSPFGALFPDGEKDGQ